MGAEKNMWRNNWRNFYQIWWKTLTYLHIKGAQQTASRINTKNSYTNILLSSCWGGKKGKEKWSHTKEPQRD